MVPELHFYDEQFHPIGAVTTMDMRYHNEFWRVGVQGRVAVPREARYIVLVAGNGDAGFGSMLPSDNGTAYFKPAAALGELSIRLFGSVGPAHSQGSPWPAGLVATTRTTASTTARAAGHNGYGKLSIVANGGHQPGQ